MVNVVRQASDVCPVVMIVDSSDHQLTGSVPPMREETEACLPATTTDLKEHVESSAFTVNVAAHPEITL